MKNSKKIFPLLLLLTAITLTLFTSCKKEDPIDPTDNPDTPETSITFTCQDTLGLPDVFVGIAPLENDRDNGIFLRSGDTDNLGKVKFENVDPQKYYYSAIRTVPGGTQTRKGEVTVEQDEEETVTVTF
jgi:hypothetical protein